MLYPSKITCFHFMTVIMTKTLLRHLQQRQKYTEKCDKNCHSKKSFTNEGSQLPIDISKIGIDETGLNCNNGYMRRIIL
jgi:hypothetical protein